MEIDSVVVVDIDGLRPDVFLEAYQAGKLPNFERLFGGQKMVHGERVPALAPAPSITFASQACLFTGAHPSQHGIPGNQFFDRFGQHNGGKARLYAFDMGDALAVDDAVRVFVDGLASKCLQTATLYEKLSARGWSSVVASHMYALGADTWLRPSLIRLARFTKGGSLFGMSAADYDGNTLKNTLEYLDKQGLPDLLTVYFMGIDHESHAHGPQAQAGYLTEKLDGMVGELCRAAEQAQPDSSRPFWILCSDHGQTSVPPDDRHSLRLAFPTEREMGGVFDALGLDVNDFPGEDPNSNAVVAANGGLAYVYLQNRKGSWNAVPDFEGDVLSVARAFWEAHQAGRYAPDLQGALSGVLVRNVEQDGWRAGYRALSQDGELLPLEHWFDGQQAGAYVDPVHRLDNLAGPMCGDLLLLSNYEEGFYFGAPQHGVHGGLNEEDSQALLLFGWPGAQANEWAQARDMFREAVNMRAQHEGGRQATTADLATGLLALIGW